MGNCLFKALRRIRGKRACEKSIVLLIVGLDNAGKTLVLNHISGDPDRNVLPTMGFRTVSLRYKSYSVKIYDIGGSSQIRSLWPKYYNDIHGLIYVVDASDISRLTENKLVFGELVTHEHISGKPLLLLANKQDINGAIDELDLVESLDVERAANTGKCPTRVETCSCVCERTKYKTSIMGIVDGYKWLLDTILKNYTALNNRIKDSGNLTIDRVSDRQSTIPDTPSKLSIHSNPFKPIKELLQKKEETSTTSNSHNGVEAGNKLKNVFASRNKTAPYPFKNPSTIDCDEQSTNSGTVLYQSTQDRQTNVVVLDPKRLNFHTAYNRPLPSRPYTAPERTSLMDKITIINIPGQVPQ